MFVDRNSPRLVMMLAHRPRLALGRDDVASVTTVLAGHAAGVRAAAPRRVDALGE